MSIAAIIKPADDSEAFAAEMSKALKRLNAHVRSIPTMPEDVVIDHAEKDAARILKGDSTYSVTAPFRNILQAGDRNRDSSYYRCGEKFYALYCETVEKTVKASRPNRKLSFPIWRD